MQVEKLVRELGGREHVPLDSAPGANEEWPQRGLQADEGPRNGERWVEMTACTAARDEDSHQAGAASGSVAAAPCTRSFVLPMFTSKPVMNKERTRLDRPYEMNGSVSPVVGSSPTTTPMCRYAVITTVTVRPMATSCRNGDHADRAIRKPSQA